MEILKAIASATKNRIVCSQSVNTPNQWLQKEAQRMLRHRQPAVFPPAPREAVVFICEQPAA